MTKRFALSAASALAALLMTAAPAPVMAADHRDSPVVDDEPAADINDVYMFRDPKDKTKLVLVLSTYPLVNPRFATSYQYDPDVIFQIGFDVDGNGTFERNVTAKFSPLSNGAGSLQTVTVTLPGGKTATGNVTQPTIQAPEPVPTIINQNGIKVFAGPGGVPGGDPIPGATRYVIDFEGDAPSGLNRGSGVSAELDLPAAAVLHKAVGPVAGRDRLWRVTLDIKTQGLAAREFRLFLKRGNGALSETVIKAIQP